VRVSGADEPQTSFRIFASDGADLGTAIVPLRLPEWGGVAFGRETMFVRGESNDGEPLIVRLRLSRQR
jgi:hypothetical protein